MKHLPPFPAPCPLFLDLRPLGETQTRTPPPRKIKRQNHNDLFTIHIFKYGLILKSAYLLGAYLLKLGSRLLFAIPGMAILWLLLLLSMPAATGAVGTEEARGARSRSPRQPWWGSAATPWCVCPVCVHVALCACPTCARTRSTPPCRFHEFPGVKCEPLTLEEQVSCTISRNGRSLTQSCCTLHPPSGGAIDPITHQQFYIPRGPFGPPPDGGCSRTVSNSYLLPQCLIHRYIEYTEYTKYTSIPFNPAGFIFYILYYWTIYCP